mmetsp:Transcript_29961/g.63172  ORF Transcript_29961/g.63172 Transcript_29961/m.63172 type:complete len:520 (+) Transcript_29961:40-1599(+)
MCFGGNPLFIYQGQKLFCSGDLLIAYTVELVAVLVMALAFLAVRACSSRNRVLRKQAVAVLSSEEDADLLDAQHEMGGIVMSPITKSSYLQRRHCICYVLGACVFFGPVAFSLSMAGPRVQSVYDGFRRGRVYKCLRPLFFPNSTFTERMAIEYFLQQKSYFQEAYRSWEIARYWTVTRGFVKPGMGWYEMLTARSKALLHEFQRSGRQDFRIEKDRCEMERFIIGNGFPATELKGVWRDRSKLAAELELLFRENEEWPLIFKVCHITIGEYDAAWASFNQSGSVTEIKKGFSSLEQAMRRVDSLWDVKPTDNTRPWMSYFDPLTNLLQPGVMVQAPFTRSRRPAELKIEVIWGRVYLGVIDTNGGAYGTCENTQGIILRDDPRVLLIDGWTWSWHREECSEWIIKEGHLRYAWHLAESFAKAAMIDAIRVDVFLYPGHPEMAVVNELSLTSAAPYPCHADFMAEIWELGHRENRYISVDFPFARPTYMNFRGESWFAVNHTGCNESLLHPYLLAKWCS